MGYEPIRARDLPKIRAQFLNTMQKSGEHIVKTMFDLSQKQANLLNAMITMTAEISELYYVSAEMTALSKHAGKQLASGFRISPTDIPCNYGMIIFENPIGIKERGGFEGTSVVVGAFWSIAQQTESRSAPLLSVYWVSDFAHPEAIRFSGIDLLSKHAMLEDGRLGLSGYCQTPMDDMIHDHGHLLGRDADYDAEELEDYNNFIKGLIATFKAACLLMGQSFVTVTEESIGRPVREKKGKTKKPPKVKIIALRKHSTKSTNNNGDPTPANFDYRFIVKGHWRMQPYGPGRKRVRPVWIAPYIKGPEDKPLRVVDKVYHLKR